MPSTKEIPGVVLEDILFLQKNICEKLDLKCTVPIAEAESKEYGAFTFKIGEKNVVYRMAKTTPTKIGQFVTIWKRLGNGPIQPYDYADDIDYFFIRLFKGNLNGLFIFPKSALVKKEILSGENKEGKRGIRVYPSWDVTESKQAYKTQQWQLEYFLELKGEEFKLDKARQLLNIH